MKKVTARKWLLVSYLSLNLNADVVNYIKNTFVNVRDFRYIDERCKLSYCYSFVSRQPFVNMPGYKYKKGNYLCKPCRIKCKNGKVKCDRCSNTARYFDVLLDGIGPFCGVCI